jgi:ribonuclease D
LIAPQDAWKRVKTRTNSGKFLAVVRELAAFREDYAQRRDVPRNRVYKDDALIELASLKPKDHKELNRARLLLREGRKGDIADGILEAIVHAAECPPEHYPKVSNSRDKLQVNPALADLLRVLLKAKTESSGVAPRLIASAAELDAISAGERDLPALRGWRAEVFGQDALRLCDGQIALSADNGNIAIVEL